jgi:hypothetical protein
VKLFSRKDCWVPTAGGWLVLALLLLSSAALATRFLNSFLSVIAPVPADVLVVESWLPDYALQAAMGEFKRGGYRRMITSGYGLPEYMRASAYRTGAELSAATLAAMGLETNLVVAVSPPKVERDRTYSSALAVRAWLESANVGVRAVNLYSLGPHSRRSWLLYQKALGSRVKVGVIASPDNSYDPKQWWATSNGFRDVLGEGIAYLYARILFHPPRQNYEI